MKTVILLILAGIAVIWIKKILKICVYVDLYFKKNKVGDLDAVCLFLKENGCSTNENLILNRINYLVSENKIQPFPSDRAWESNYPTAKIATRIIKLK